MERLADYTRAVSSLPKGTAFTRYAIALTRAKGDIMTAELIARQWTDTPQVGRILKAAVAAGTTTDADWAEPLVDYRLMVAEFVELLRPLTILGRLTGMRNVPPYVSFVSQSGGALVGWVGQNIPAPVGDMAFALDNIGAAKAAGIVVLTADLVRATSGVAEQTVRTELLAAMAQFLDEQFINPAVAAVADISPASITNGAPTVPSTGSTVAAITTDFESLFSILVSAGVKFIAPVIIMSPLTALGLSMKTTTTGTAAFPTVSVRGGTLFGVPVLVSGNVPSSVSGGSIIVLADAAEIMTADDGMTTLDTSEQASLQMRTDPQTGAQQLVSLWQMNLAAIRVVRFINWKVRRAGAVAYIDGVHY